MALLAEKEDNESYNFKETLKQLDAANFIEAMPKETRDHESKLLKSGPYIPETSACKNIINNFDLEEKEIP